MQALITTPGRPGAVRVDDVAAPAPNGIRVRTLEVGVCGTDREIAEGTFGSAPPGDDHLILGHEFVGEVVEDAAGFSAGELVTATVRRACGHCAACAAGSPDACDTGEYTERGITALHGFAGELVAEAPEHLVRVPASLGRLGVLAEPGSICVRGIRHARVIGGRQVWTPSRALVIGAGAIGMLATYQLRLAGMTTWTAARGEAGSEKARLVEATGNAEVMLSVLGLLRRNGVGCLLGLDAHSRPISIDSAILGVDTVIENRALFGSVNAHASDGRVAVEQLDAIRERWPEALEAMVGLRVAPDRFADAFAYRGVKATLQFE